VSRINFHTRSAGADDRATIQRLDAEASLSGESFRGGQILAESLDDFVRRWPDSGLAPSRRFYVVTERNVIVGFASVDLDTRPRPLMTRIFVVPQARNLGAGALLLQHVIADVGGHTSGGLDALSLPGDRETKNLYERQGMKARLIVASSGL
jgi:GNAT superfamily N-acetyltransferase